MPHIDGDIYDAARDFLYGIEEDATETVDLAVEEAPAPASRPPRKGSLVEDLKREWREQASQEGPPRETKGIVDDLSELQGDDRLGHLLGDPQARGRRMQRQYMERSDSQAPTDSRKV